MAGKNVYLFGFERVRSIENLNSGSKGFRSQKRAKMIQAIRPKTIRIAWIQTAIQVEAIHLSHGGEVAFQKFNQQIEQNRIHQMRDLDRMADFTE